MACDLETTQAAACESGIGKVGSPISLLQLIAQLSCEIADAGGGGGTPGGLNTQVQYNDGGAFGGDAGFTFSEVNKTVDLGGGTVVANDPVLSLTQTWSNAAVAFTGIDLNITNTASSAASLFATFRLGGVTVARIERSGDIYGANVSDNSGGSLLTSNGLLLAGAYSINFSTRSKIRSPADAMLTLLNAAEADFSLLQFGGTAATFPALKRSSAILQARLADDTNFTELECSNIITNNAAAAVSTNTTLTDNAGGGAGTLTNAPSAGDPTKWIAIDDNGTPRFIPTWT